MYHWISCDHELKEDSVRRKGNLVTGLNLAGTTTAITHSLSSALEVAPIPDSQCSITAHLPIHDKRPQASSFLQYGNTVGKWQSLEVKIGYEGQRGLGTQLGLLLEGDNNNSGTYLSGVHVCSVAAVMANSL